MRLSLQDLALRAPGVACATGARGAIAAALGCAVLAVSACSSNKPCIDPSEPYLHAREHPPLRIPEDLSEPDRSAVLKIPDVAASAARPGTQTRTQTRTVRSGCLADPPSYFRSADAFARTPEEVVAGWAQAWANREADAVLALYSSGFQAPTDSADRAAWLEQRREQVATGPVPDPVLGDLRIRPEGEDRRIATFVQRFGTNSLEKELTLVREAGSWRIVAERVTEVR